MAGAERSSQEDPEEAERYARLRERMVREQIRPQGVTDDRILDAMRSVPRHRLVPASVRDRAYEDRPLPIGHGQTISQPYIVARMTELAEPEPGDRALDVGTGSGYQAAVLAELVEQVHSIEIVCELAERARENLAGIGYDHITIRCGDGYQGWSDAAPFDVIIVAAANEQVPPPLVEQLAEGGRLVLPVGPEGGTQVMTVVTKRADGSIEERRGGLVRFVPMTGEASDD